MDIIKKSERVSVVLFSLVYDWVGKPGCGFSFDCDHAGVVDTAALAPPAFLNYLMCVFRTHEVTCVGVVKYTHSWREVAIGRCSCGTEIGLGNFTNTCHGCGADYNGSGQLLAPREQWGCETGEHWTECY